MTETQCRLKLEEIAQYLARDIVEEGMRLFRSSGVDPEAFEDNYVLPKVLLVVAGGTVLKQFTIDTHEFRAAARNLKHF
jgi:hypothetical protein